MSADASVPTLQQVVGALIFGSKRPLSAREICRCLEDVAQKEGGIAAAFRGVSEREVKAAIDEIARALAQDGYGFRLSEIAGGFRFHTDPLCGLWLRYLLNQTRMTRLSRPALESLAIIAYRQPITRAEIEAVRGVAVDHIIKLLLDLQLIRIVGRSNLPGRPFLYGTTRTFLEYFGLRDLKQLVELDPSLIRSGVAAVVNPPAAEPAVMQAVGTTDSDEKKDLTNEDLPANGQPGS